MKLFFRNKKKISVFLIVLIANQIIYPTVTMALTGGATQPEVQSFQAAGTTEMVDLFSGDFSYNIPLFELPGPSGGYPFNLSYQSGIGMDQESSWCGLGWNLQPGAINRQMRGLPDEFNGDSIYTKMSISPSVTVGYGGGLGAKLFGSKLKLKVGLSVSKNNYKGCSYSIDGSVGYSKTNGDGRNTGLGGSLDFKLDSKEGVNVTPSLSLAGKTGEIGVSAGYNSKEGLTNISGSYSYQKSWLKQTKDRNGDDAIKKKNVTASGSASLSFVHPGYTPQISMPMRSENLSGTFRIGAAWWGIYPSLYLQGFYNEQYLLNDKMRVLSRGYGYLHYQDGTKSASSVLDINREKDGMIIKESPNLSIPSLSYDIYSVSGQGISAMYRPMRNDYGSVHDPSVASESMGGSAGIDLGVAFAHISVNLGVNHSKSTSGRWAASNAMSSLTKFQDSKLDSLYEPWYFKVHGESTIESTQVLDNLGGEQAVRVQLGGGDSDPYASSTLENNSSSWHATAPSSDTVNRARKPRTQVIQNYTNQQLLDSNGRENLSQFKISYIDSTGVERSFDRSLRANRHLAKHHIAAFTALTSDGLRYNYGLPAYNLKQEEATFSVRRKRGQVSRVDVGHSDPTASDYKEDGDPFYEAPGTDKFLKRVEMAPFAHSHLLTSILGSDYVDVTGDGVTADDLGYWVKFTYKKMTSDYKWRDPYCQAHFQEGWRTDPRDDKGSFTYGEKEMWYLARAETKSHVATFTIQKREDGKGVNRRLQDDYKVLGKNVYALTEIRLFSRFSGSANPIKVVRLEHDYSLCTGAENSTPGRGKLTLKRVWFEYGSSHRGQLNPYVFDYHETDVASNPSYDNHAYDRWGNYKPYSPEDALLNFNNDFPYCEQDPSKKAEIDAHASVWSLRSVQLPSGGKVIIDYETDDYGYVQHLPAMQMMEVTDSEITDGMIRLTDADVKVRFKLESSVKVPPSATKATLRKFQTDEVLKYLDVTRKQLYFKLKMNLRKPIEEYHEYICGYADINMDTSKMGLESDASGNYAVGYFEVKREEGRHPFSLRTWQHIRTNQPDLANSAKTQTPSSNTEQTDDAGQRIDQIKSMGSIGDQIRTMFNGFNNFCAGAGWGRDMIAGKSWIRLNSPDKIKFGGGLRVRQITMLDQWSQDKEGVYGQVYEYDIDEEGSGTISSGVASYEPFIGGDENPLRYSKKYVQAVRLRSDNNMFFEYPINETYYPGPQVGYRKVTVTSLAAASLAGKMVKNVDLSNGRTVFPKGDNVSYGTTGKTEHEFYTAKDFPVIADETEKQNKPYRMVIPVPFIGSITTSKLSASQGYSIVTNDMHGKPKKVSNYRQDNHGNLEPSPISWVKYNYFCDSTVYQQQNVFALKNVFKDNGDGSLGIATAEELGDPSVAKFTMGQEHEFFTDMRQFEDKSWTGGAEFNIENVFVVWATVIFPIPWPNITKTTVQLRTAVANKIIFKSGVLESVEAFDGGSTVVTRNLKWNKVTGATVLTMVNNNFDKSVYSYSIPAFTQYQGMGAAYQNIGLTFSIKGVKQDTYKKTLYQFTSPVSGNLLPGDEILLYKKGSNVNTPLASVVYTGAFNGQTMLSSGAVALTEKEYEGMIVRSGYRNQLSVQAGSITALQDPSIKGQDAVFTKKITIPN